MKFIIPAGTYRIGDPCYSLPDHLWSDFCDEIREGEDADKPVAVSFKGHPLVTFVTMYGDGTYYDEQRRDYSVDTGLIAAVPVEFPNLKPEHSYNGDPVILWYVVEFTEPVECYAEKGKIHFGDIVIDTAEDEDFSEAVSYWDDADEEYDLESSWDVESEYLDDDE